MFSPTGQLQGALPSTGAIIGSEKKGYTLKTPVQQGGTALLPLTGILPEAVPKGAKQAAAPTVSSDQVGGVVWRDFKPGGGTPGKLDSGELGLPGVNLKLLDASGNSVGSATTNEHLFSRRRRGPGHRRRSRRRTHAVYGGVSRLTEADHVVSDHRVPLGVPVSMVGSRQGSRIPRDTLEAARTDGASSSRSSAA